MLSVAFNSRHSPASRRRQRGTALVESSLIIMVFLFMLLAILDFGQFLFFHQVLSERVRHAARYAVLHASCNTDCVKNIVVYNSAGGADASNDIRIMNLSAADIDVTMPDSSADARLTVAVTRYDFLILSPFLSRTGTARMRTLVASAPVEDPI